MSSVESGERELLISTEQSQANSTLVAVRDSGPGIDPERLERVFEAFYTTKSGGLGMGLSICRSIIEAHGGRLWASANLPRGASFQFSLHRSAGLDEDRECIEQLRRLYPRAAISAVPSERSRSLLRPLHQNGRHSTCD
jgi:signal transduction histidine kinase